MSPTFWKVAVSFYLSLEVWKYKVQTLRWALQILEAINEYLQKKVSFPTMTRFYLCYTEWNNYLALLPVLQRIHCRQSVTYVKKQKENIFRALKRMLNNCLWNFLIDILFKINPLKVQSHIQQMLYFAIVLLFSDFLLINQLKQKICII